MGSNLKTLDMELPHASNPNNNETDVNTLRLKFKRKKSVWRFRDKSKGVFEQLATLAEELEKNNKELLSQKFDLLTQRKEDQEKLDTAVSEIEKLKETVKALKADNLKKETEMMYMQMKGQRLKQENTSMRISLEEMEDQNISMKISIEELEAVARMDADMEVDIVEKLEAINARWMDKVNSLERKVGSQDLVRTWPSPRSVASSSFRVGVDKVNTLDRTPGSKDLVRTWPSPGFAASSSSRVGVDKVCTLERSVARAGTKNRRLTLPRN